MAISSPYVRPNSMKTDAYNYGIQVRMTHHESQVIVQGTVPASGSLLTGFAAADAAYTDADSGDAVICSGVIVAIGESFGILMQDAKTADTGSFITKGVRILLQLESGETPVAGDIAYVNTTTGEIRDDAAGAKVCGTFASADTFTGDANLPTGKTFCLVDWDAAGTNV